MPERLRLSSRGQREILDGEIICYKRCHMSSSAAEISQRAIKLPARERAALIDKLFDSIDSEIDPVRTDDIEKRWAAESERRIDSVERGALEVVNGPEALRKIRRAIEE
jgi:putative addiction module component (TIGR02574 family)